MQRISRLDVRVPHSFRGYHLQAVVLSRYEGTGCIYSSDRRCLDWCLRRAFLHLRFLFIGSDVVTRRQTLEAGLKAAFLAVSTAAQPVLCRMAAA